jgi:phage/plasmid-associated DNA primase
LIQKSEHQIETALVIIGEQGIGKNKFFTDVISKLFGSYAIRNENILRNNINRFNSSIENMILIVCNEFQSIDNANYLNTNCLKSLIADRFCMIESKFVNFRTINSVSNFIFVSNNHFTIKIENNDRRYLVFKCKDNVKGNLGFFANLNNQFDRLLYQ